MQRVNRIIHSKLYYLSQVAGSLCRCNETTIIACFRKALDNGITVIELREVILTSYLFDGYPTALEGFRLLARCQVSVPDSINTSPIMQHEPQADTEILGVTTSSCDDLSYHSDNVSLWRQRGEKLCGLIYGPQYLPLMDRVAQIAPELSDSMIVEGYGKVLSRGGLDTMLRELCVVTILSVKNRPRQLLSHTLGALRLGATTDDLQTVLQSISKLFPLENFQSVNQIFNKAQFKIVP